MQRNTEGKSTAAIVGGFGSSACTMYGNGAKVSCSKGKITYTDPKGEKTVYEGSGYTASKEYHADGTYDVKLKITP